MTTLWTREAHWATIRKSSVAIINAWPDRSSSGPASDKQTHGSSNLDDSLMIVLHPLQVLSRRSVSPGGDLGDDASLTPLMRLSIATLSLCSMSLTRLRRGWRCSIPYLHKALKRVRVVCKEMHDVWSTHSSVFWMVSSARWELRSIFVARLA